MNVTKVQASFIATLFITGCASSSGGMGAPPNPVASPGTSAQAANTSTSSYSVTALGTLGGSASSGNSINQLGLTSGSSNLAGNEYAQAVLWKNDAATSLGTLSGENSGVFWPNHNTFGMLAGVSETAQADPLGEDWSCQNFFPTVPDTKHVCVGFVWLNNKMTALPTLGGINGYAAGTNDFGQVAGWAETTVHDPTCTAVTKTPNSFYQVLQFEPVVWNFGGSVRRLPTLGSDPDGAATAVNDAGTVVGISGTCDQAVGRFTAAHAVVWEDGNPQLIPTFGGVSWNTPAAINSFGAVAGFANLPGGGDASGALQPVAFYWTKSQGTVQIPPLPGDAYSMATSVNDEGQVVGVSYGAGFASARAFLWQNGKEIDLNSVNTNAALYLLVANDIDDRGEIVGQALDSSTGETPGFTATPSSKTHWVSPWATQRTPALPMNVRTALERRLGMPQP